MLAGTNATSAVVLPPMDGDLGWQHWLGAHILRSGLPHALGPESFAATGAPWVPQEWLFCSLLAAAAANGLAQLFAFAVGMCAAVALACVAIRCARHGCEPLPVALVLVFVDVAMAQSFGVRVQVVAWALLAAFLVALELPARYRWTAVAVAAAWANVHASAMLAPVLAAVAAAGSFIHGNRRAAGNDALLALCCGLAVCATPLGAALPEYAVALLRSPLRHWIHEWRPASLADPALAFGLLPLLVLGAPALRAGRWRALALALPFCYLAWTAARNVPLAAIACAPLAAHALTTLLPSLSAFRLAAGRLPAVTAAFAAAFFTAASVTAFAAHGARDERPLVAIQVLAHQPGRHRLFCENFAWCGPALDAGNIGVFLDGRADPFPLAVWTQYDAVVHARPAWQHILRGRDVDAMLVTRGARLDRAARRTGWRIAYEAPVRLLIRPRKPPSGSPVGATHASPGAASAAPRNSPARSRTPRA